MALLGRNGVGKTTFLKCLMGVQQIASGSISFLGQDISQLTPHARAKLGIAYVPQGREIFARLTVEENILMGMATKPSRQAHDIKEEVFDLFPVLRTMLKRRGGDLSGGQQQQLAIGRALLTNPKLLILDEPTEGIQPNIIDQIGDAIKMLRAEGEMSILLVEQYLDFCKELGDDFAILERGSVAAAGEMTDLTENVVKEFLTV